MYGTKSSACSSGNVLNAPTPEASNTVFLSLNVILLSSTYHYELIKFHLLVFATSSSSGLTNSGFHLNFYPVASCSCNCPSFVFIWHPRIHTEKKTEQGRMLCGTTRHSWPTQTEKPRDQQLTSCELCLVPNTTFLNTPLLYKQSIRIILVFGKSVQSLVEYKLRHLT